MSNTFLDDQEATSPQGKGSFAKYELKIQHLNDLNKKIYIENQQLRTKVKLLEQQKMDFIHDNFTQDSIIQNIETELRAERQKNHELSKQNQELLAKILLNQQLNVQTKKQFDFYLNRYEQKILQLRQNLQMKEVQIQTLEEKYQKYKGLQIPISMKNANRYTAEMLKYETLIEEMIQQRNMGRSRNVQQVHYALKYFQRTENQLKKIKPKKGKTQTIISSHTDIRSKTAQLTEDSQDPSKLLNKDKLDVMFLRLHLQLRQLKKRFKDKCDENIQLRNKDKIMKQGYMTLTKEMEKIKIENCQLQIQFQHLDKKIKTSKQIRFKTKSAGSIQKSRERTENKQQKVSSQVSIQGNFSEIKQYLKVSLPSETKYDTLSANKSHNFDEKIENIEGILSLDSDPDFSQFKNKKQVILENDQDQNPSICEQNEVDMSISLNTSGFQAPNKSHHEISEHILAGLFEKRVFLNQF